MANIEGHYRVQDIEKRILAALRTAGLDPERVLSPVDLGALDHFHTGGFSASLILQELARIQASDRVLDIGAGLAGAARMLAAAPGCLVDCIELSDDYCVGAKLLNQITGLQERVTIFKGSATEMPFTDNVFDVAWMQNVGMNIQDKQTFYAEVARVLKPGGRFAFQEMLAGRPDVLEFPLPWASDASENFLLTAAQMKKMLEALGFVADYFEDVSESQQNFSVKGSNNSSSQVNLSLTTYVDNLGLKAENAQRSLMDGRTRFYRGVFILQ